jgi:hypothetical protein
MRAAPSDEIMKVFCFLYPLVMVDFLFFIDDFHLETKVILDHEAFIFTLAHSSRIFSTGLLDMVYELL